MLKQTNIRLSEIHSKLHKLNDRVDEIAGELDANKSYYESGKIDLTLLLLREQALMYELYLLELKGVELKEDYNTICVMIECGIDFEPQTF
jgi:hypothetical protein